MTVETDTLVEAAQRFSEAIRSERSATVETLEAERKAAVQIIEALRRENDRRSQASGGNFVIGFAIGAALGAVAIYMLAPRSGDENRVDLRARGSQVSASLAGRFKAALAAGKRAATESEQQLWAQYRKRVQSDEGARRDPIRGPL